MLRPHSAIAAVAMGILMALASSALAGRIAPDTPAIMLAGIASAAEPAAEAEPVELVSTSSRIDEIRTTNAVAVAAPAPAALAIFGIGLLGLAAARRLRRR